MTNNPTIDGVSRKLLKELLHFAPDGLATELQALLYAPAVERQEPDMCKKCGGVGFLPGTQNCRRCHGSGSEPVDVAALQSTIAQLQARIGELESGLGEPVAWMYKREGGEVLGQLVQMESDDLKCIRLGKCHDNGVRYMWPREDYIEWKPLFNTTTAPIAAVPEGWKLVPVEATRPMLRAFIAGGCTRDSYRAMLNASPAYLVTTAALNKESK